MEAQLPNDMKRATYYLYVFISVAILQGCDVPPQEMALRWQMPIAEKSNFYPIADGKHLILPSKCGSLDCLKKVDPKTGETKWQWVDSSALLQDIYYNHTPYLYGNMLVLPNGKDLIAIDTEHGKTKWVLQDTMSGASHLGGTCDLLTRSYSTPDQQRCLAKTFDLRTGDVINEYKLESSSDSILLNLRSPDIFITKSGDTLCMAGLAAYVPRGGTDSFLEIWKIGAESRTARVSILEDDPRGECITKQGVIGENGKTYWMAGNLLFCITPNDGRVLWKKELPRDMLSSQPYLTNGLLLLACEDEKLYALDASNGETLWTTPIAGTPSRLFVENNTIYLVGGSDQKLYCIDLSTGSLLHKYEAEQQGFRRLLWVGAHTLVLQEGSGWHAFALPDIELLPATLPPY